MPYFPTKQESAYFCPNCQAWYTRATMHCLVIHPPGTCCHEYEHQMEDPRREPSVYNEDLIRRHPTPQARAAMHQRKCRAMAPFTYAVAYPPMTSFMSRAASRRPTAMFACSSSS